jgi:transposase
MNDLLIQSDAKMRRLEPHFPLSHGIPRVDDRSVRSGILFVIRNGLRWRDAPREYGPHKTIYNRFIRWSRLGVFDRIFVELSKDAGTEHLMIDTTHIKAHRTAATLRCIGRSRGGLTTKLHAVCDGRGRPVLLCLTKDRPSEYKGAAMMLDAPPRAKTMLADRGYDARWFRQALIEHA